MRNDDQIIDAILPANETVYFDRIQLIKLLFYRIVSFERIEYIIGLNSMIQLNRK